MTLVRRRRRINLTLFHHIFTSFLTFGCFSFSADRCRCLSLSSKLPCHGWLVGLGGLTRFVGQSEHSDDPLRDHIVVDLFPQGHEPKNGHRGGGDINSLSSTERKVGQFYISFSIGRETIMPTLSTSPQIKVVHAD